MKIKGTEKVLVFLKIMIPALSLIGTAGSFYLSLSGETPCPYCLTARYSLIFILIISCVAFFFEKVLFYIITSLISILPMGASLILIINDYRIEGSEICYADSGVYCTSPLFLGIHVSIYAFLIALTIFGVSSLIVILKLLKQ